MTATPIWTTRDGMRIPLRKMTNLHLRNALALVKRKVAIVEDEMAATFACSCSGEMASYYAAGAQDDVTAKAARLYLALFTLEAEQKRRGG